MKITLINPPSLYLQNPLAYTPYGLMIVASYYRMYKNEVNIIDMNIDTEIPESDIYGITCVSPNVPEIDKIIWNIQESYPDKKIILGGPHIKYTNEYNTFKRYKTNLGIRLLPARDLIDQKRYTNTTIYSSFGCVYNCSFCCKRKYTELPIKLVERDLSYVVDHGAKYIIFGDDNININRDRLIDILQITKNYSVPFRLNMDSRNIREDMLKVAKDSGCKEISIGIESGSQKMLTLMNKHISVTTNTLAVQMIKNSGMKCRIYLIVNFPGETEGTIDETIKFLNDTKPDSVLISQFAPLPGSDTYNNPEKYSITYMSKDWSDYVLAGKGFKSSFETNDLPISKQEKFWNTLKEYINGK